MADWKRRFYLSKEWRHMRLFVITRDRGMCQLCGKFVSDTPEVDHIVELTEGNYTDPDISLNPDLLRTVHRTCHNRRHNRFCGHEKQVIVDADLNIDYSRRVNSENPIHKSGNKHK